jgi:Glycosyl transferase family 2
MSAILLAAATCLLALIPAFAFRRNLRAYSPPPPVTPGAAPIMPAMSVLIPARDEERSIGTAVESVLASEGVQLEVIVLDDHSRDATAAIVADIATRDPRVRVLPAPPLPEGWCGKQYACAALAELASYGLLVFIDADVRLAPRGLLHMEAFISRSGAALVSGFPRQETGTFWERIVIPLIHFLLLGFLPLRRMRQSRHPAYGAGCGQLIAARHAAYQEVGGHGAIRGSLHDGLTLPRAFRAAGLGTDLFDATEVATCRMYRNARELWRGVTKNATEGLATPTTIVPATLVLLGGQVLPPFLLVGATMTAADPLVWWLAAIATGAAYYPRLVAARRFRQSLLGAVFHPLGIVAFLTMQWYAFLCAVLGRPATWKGRAYALRQW